jgi:hypothetical protein
MQDDYRTPEELKYYGSDLNKFINENCSKEMTAINMDLIIYKRSKRHIRIIESKHLNENIQISQKELLRILSTASFLDYKYEVFIVIGNPPDYEPVTIIDVTNNKEYHINFKKDFIDWLEFDKELTDNP